MQKFIEPADLNFWPRHIVALIPREGRALQKSIQPWITYTNPAIKVLQVMILWLVYSFSSSGPHHGHPIPHVFTFHPVPSHG
jgi:hypothetical protein